MKKRFYYIDSSKRISGSDGSFSFRLDIPLNEEYDTVCVTQASIPISYYLVQEGFNTFTLIENNINYDLKVPVGNYNLNSFCLIVADLMSKATGKYTYIMSYPNSYNQTNTGKISILVKPLAAGDSFAINLTSKNTLYEQFGLNTGLNKFVFDGVNHVLNSSNVVKFVNENTLFLRSDIVHDGDTDVLQALYNGNQNTLSNLVFSCPDILGYSKSMRSIKTGLANFYLTDENNNAMNLNGQNMVFTLLIYKREVFFENANNFMFYLYPLLQDSYSQTKKIVEFLDFLKNKLEIE
jgi:hypothetical protein